MIAKIFQEHMPEWIEAGSIIGTILAAGIAAAAIALYKIDHMQDDITEIKTIMAIVPVISDKVKENEEDIKTLEKRATNIEVNHARRHPDDPI